MLTSKDERAHLDSLVAALDVSLGCFERPNCRGFVGDWQITGTLGHIMADGEGYLLYAKPGKSAKRWNNVKKALSFARVTQDGDDEGCLHLDRLPTPAEAVLIRAELGIRRRRHLSPEEVAARTANFERLRTPSKSTVRDPGSPQTVGLVPEVILGTLNVFELPDGTRLTNMAA